MATLVFPNGQKISKVQLIMLDKDGTIFDIHHYWCSMIRLRAKMLTQLYCKENSNSVYNQLCDVMGIDKSSNKLKPEGPIGIKPRSYITQVVSTCLEVNSIFLSPIEVEAEFKKADQESEKNLEHFLSILPGVRAFLEKCILNGITLTIATTDITRRAQAAVNVMGISELFSFICGADAVETTKPAKDMAELTLKHTQFQPQEAVMIGDHNVDLIFAKNSGLKASIGVTTGLLKQTDLGAYSSYIMDDLSQIEIIND